MQNRFKSIHHFQLEEANAALRYFRADYENLINNLELVTLVD